MGEDVVWAAMGGVTYEGNRGRLSRYTDQNWCGGRGLRERHYAGTANGPCGLSEGRDLMRLRIYVGWRRTGAGRTGGRGRELEVMVWCGGGGGVFGDNYLLFRDYSI